MGLDAMILVFLIFSHKLVLSLSSFTLIKRLFSPSLLSAIRVVLSAYLRLLIFLLLILIPAYNSSRPAFLMMSSVYGLTNRMTADSFVVLLSRSWTSCSIQDSNCCFLTRIQVSQQIAKMVWYSHLSKSSPQFAMIHTVKIFSIVNETEIDFFFLKFPFFLWKWKSLSCVQLFVTPWTIQSMEFLGQNTGVGSLSLLQGIFPTQGSNPGLLHCRQILYQLSHKGSPRILEWAAYPFSKGSSRSRNRTRVSCIAGGFFTNWIIREAPE